MIGRLSGVGQRWRALWRGDLPGLIFVVLVAAAAGLLWLFSIPFNQAPDEAAHFQVVRFIMDQGRLPLFDPSELWLIRTPVGVVETYAAFPPLAYVLMAFLSPPLPLDRLWDARLVSLGSYLGSVALTFLIARQVVPSRRDVAVVAGLLVALLPQVAFTGAYVNNDSPGVLLTGLVFYLLVRGWRRGFEPWLLFAIGGVAGALLITKYTLYAVALVGLAAPLVSVRQPREAGRRTAFLVPGAALVSAWWFLRNWLVYGEVIPGEGIARAKAAAGGNTLFVPSDHGITLLTLSTETNFWEQTLKSFVAGFGRMEVFLPPGYYWACAALAALGLVGLAWLAVSRDLLRGSRAFLTTALAATVGTVLAAMAISTYGEYSPQGRYLFAVLIPAAIVVAVGWASLAKATRLLGWIAPAAVGGLAVLNVISLAHFVVPRYYGPGSTRLVVQIDAPASPQAWGSEIEVMGWALAAGGGEWRPYAPEAVTRYRRPVRQVQVYVDGPPDTGVFLGTARYGTARPDVRDTYGGIPTLERLGYRLVIPAGALAPGRHVVFACATADGADQRNCSSRAFEVV